MDRFDLYIALVALAFAVLAFVLLYPIYRFLQKQEEYSKHWTRKRSDGSPQASAKGQMDRANGTDRA